MRGKRDSSHQAGVFTRGVLKVCENIKSVLIDVELYRGIVWTFIYKIGNLNMENAPE
jgi:hypothetical protein